MSERETTRLIAWSAELRRVHARLRESLVVARTALDGGSAEQATRDLLIYCHGFCVALDGHHRGEDRVLFPSIAKAHPELAPVLRSLEQDHSMITYLVGELRAAVERSSTPREIERHLDGVGAVMENHFRFEEKVLLEVLSTLELTVDPSEVLGPL